MWRALLQQVSTSNAIVADEVHIETDAPVVWTTQLHMRAPGGGGSDGGG